MYSGKISDFGTTTVVCNIYRISYWWNDTVCSNLFINLVCRNIKKNIGKQKMRKQTKKHVKIIGVNLSTPYFPTKFITSYCHKIHKCIDKTFVCTLYQSHYREVIRWEIFMEQKLRFGLNLGRLAVLKKRVLANYEQLLRVVFSCFQGQKNAIIFYKTL